MTDEEILEIKQLLESKPKAHFEEYNEPIGIGNDDLKAILRSWDDKRQALDGVFLILNNLQRILCLPKEATLQQIAEAAQAELDIKARRINWLASMLAYACHNSDGECFLPRGRKCPLGEMRGEYTCQDVTGFGWYQASAKRVRKGSQ